MRASDRVLRRLWMGAVAVYVAAFLLSLPLLVDQYTTLTGSALTMGFQVWSSETLRAELEAARLPVNIWAATRLAAELLTSLGWVAMGLLIFARRAGDRFGLFVSLFLVTFGLASSGAYSALTAAYPQLEAWLSLGVSMPWLAFYVFFYTFPSGAFVPRWTMVWSPVFLALLVSLFLFFPEANLALGFPLILAAFGSALFAQAYRYARVSNPTQRVQTKWVTLAISVIALGEIIGQGLLPLLFPVLVNEPAVRLRYGMALVLAVPLFLLVPLAVAIAILRYRLWDIDVILRRSLIYAVLSAVLALAYFGSVLVLESVFRAVTGQGQNSLVVVLSTLAIAALFGPLRSRVQRVIDRRFFRQKYDAARTLADFGAQARDTVDLDDLTKRLVAVADVTLRPTSVGLWLKPAARPDRRNRLV